MGTGTGLVTWATAIGGSFFAVIVIGVGLLLLTRRMWGELIGFAAFAVSWWAPDNVQSLVAYTLTWFLLLAGPVGVFEFDAFGKGTETLARAIAASQAFSIAGGGDTLAAVDKYGIAGDVSYISTGGGAFLEFLEGKTLPAVAALEARAG